MDFYVTMMGGKSNCKLNNCSENCIYGVQKMASYYKRSFPLKKKWPIENIATDVRKTELCSILNHLHMEKIMRSLRGISVESVKTVIAVYTRCWSRHDVISASFISQTMQNKYNVSVRRVSTMKRRVLSSWTSAWRSRSGCAVGPCRTSAGSSPQPPRASAPTGPAICHLSRLASNSRSKTRLKLWCKIYTSRLRWTFF